MIQSASPRMRLKMAAEYLPLDKTRDEWYKMLIHFPKAGLQQLELLEQQEELSKLERLLVPQSRLHFEKAFTLARQDPAPLYQIYLALADALRPWT